jgi:hypothetical protein
MNTSEEGTYSIQITVQKTVKEYGFVSILVTKDLIAENGELDVDKLMECARNSAHNENMKWYRESCEIDLNPIQKPSHDEEMLQVDYKGIELDKSEEWVNAVKIKQDD